MIFISHGEREDWVRELRERLVQGLETKGYVPRFDRHLRDEAEEWPETLERWMMECDGAVIILDERARTRPWCWAEISHLMLRYRFDQLPVAIVDAGMDHAKLNRFVRETTRALDKEMIPAQGRAPEDVLRDVMGRLGPAESLGKDQITASYLAKVVEALQGASVHNLSDAARALGKQEELEAWPFLPTLRARVAQWMLVEQNLQAVAKSLRMLPSLRPDQRTLVLRYSATFKVALANVADVPEIIRSEDSHRTFKLRRRCCIEAAKWQLMRPFAPEALDCVPLPRNAPVPLWEDVEMQLERALELDGSNITREVAIGVWNAVDRIVVLDGEGDTSAKGKEIAKRYLKLPICVANAPDIPHLRAVGMDWADPDVLAAHYKLAVKMLNKD